MRESNSGLISAASCGVAEGQDEGRSEAPLFEVTCCKISSAFRSTWQPQSWLLACTLQDKLLTKTALFVCWDSLLTMILASLSFHWFMESKWTKRLSTWLRENQWRNNSQSKIETKCCPKSYLMITLEYIKSDQCVPPEWADGLLESFTANAVYSWASIPSKTCEKQEWWPSYYYIQDVNWEVLWYPIHTAFRTSGTSSLEINLTNWVTSGPTK